MPTAAALPTPPRWASRATAALARACGLVRVLAATTPVNLASELERLTRAFRAGEPSAPRFAYEVAPAHGELRRALEAVADALAGKGELGPLYAARALELADEAVVCERAGLPGLWEAARRRYARRDGFDEAADALAAAWLDEPPPTLDDGPSRVRSDDASNPASLLRRMRHELERRGLALVVVAKENLASLAATGDGVVQVAAGRALTRADVERTVLHEIAGHVAPRVVAAGLTLGLFAVGTARGSDDQEGRALAIERRAGFLDPARRAELALRHLAARSVEARADFIETARALLAKGAPLEAGLRLAARAHRGGGLAREAVYLPALLRVEAAVAADPELDRVLACGRVAVEAASTLAPWVGSEHAPAHARA